MHIKNIIEKVGGPRLILAIVGLFVLLLYGISVFFTPSYEIMYNHRTLPIIPGKEGSLYVHILEIGNTGGNAQDRADVLFSSEALSSQILPIKVENFGKVTRKVEISRDNDTTRIALGVLKPEMRVQITLYFLYKQNDKVPEWQEIFKGIEVEEGKVVMGDPGWTTFGRMVYSIFGFLI